MHSPFHPCIKPAGAIFDMTDPCHQESSLDPPAGIAPDRDAEQPGFFCPLVQVNAQLATDS
ncbi:MAG: hypothetical protein ACR2QE_09290 [Acidimicrobiales bacterium]